MDTRGLPESDIREVERFREFLAAAGTPDAPRKLSPEMLAYATGKDGTDEDADEKTGRDEPCCTG